jgi:hypothetical protein
MERCFLLDKSATPGRFKPRTQSLYPPNAR